MWRWNVRGNFFLLKKKFMGKCWRMNLIDWEPKVLFSNRAKQLLLSRFDFLQINKRIEMSIFYVTKIYPTLPFFNTVYIFAFDRAVQYFDVTNKSSSFTVECVPEELEKKTTLLLYFARYMDEHLIQVSAMFFWKSEMNLVYRFRNKL